MLFPNGYIVACIKKLSKIGLLDNIGIFITIGEVIKDKDGNNLKEKRVFNLSNVTNESVTCHTNYER